MLDELWDEREKAARQLQAQQKLSRAKKRVLTPRNAAKPEKAPSTQRVDQIDFKILRLLDTTMQYLLPKFTSVTYQGETKNLTAVVRVPSKPGSSDEWLATHAPPEALRAAQEPMRVIEAKAQPTMQSFVPAVKASLHVASKVGVSDAQTIVDEARRFAVHDPQQDQINQIAKRQGLTRY